MLKEVLLCLALVQSTHSVDIGVACSSNADCTSGNGGAHSVCNTNCECDTGYTADGTSSLCEADLGTTCSAAADCTAQHTNSECAGSVCVCSSGYTDSNTASTDGGTCQADLGTTCSANADCTAQHANSECSSTTCSCQSTYYDDNGASVAGGACQTGLALDAACHSVTAVAQDAACAAGKANSECTGTSGAETCQCVNGYYKSGTSCVVVLGSSCSANTDCVTTRSLANSFCSSTSVCACQSGYEASNNLCSQSGAERLLATFWTLGLLVFIALY